MTTSRKQLMINRLQLPQVLADIIKDYAFHTIKKIDKKDKRYDILSTIPPKEYDPSDGVTFVYMRISSDKDYFLTYLNFQIQLQTFAYVNETIYGIDGHIVTIE